MVGVQEFAEPESEHPKLTAINAKLRDRQEAQESREKEVKTDLVKKASTYLEDFYKVNNICFQDIPRPPPPRLAGAKEEGGVLSGEFAVLNTVGRRGLC